MKKLKFLFAFALLFFAVSSMTVRAAEDSAYTIAEGIYMGNIDLSGLSVSQAKSKVGEFVETLKTKNVTFGTVGEHYVSVMAGDLGLTWTNEGDIDTAATLGKKGNIVKRYKAMQDLKYGNKVYNIELSFDKDIIRNVLEEQCAEYDIKAQNATMTRVDGQFVIEEGQTGEAVNVEESLNTIYDYLTTGWDYADASIDLVIDVTEPKGSKEELSLLTDVLGKYTTSYSTSSAARCKNVENGCRLINGTLLYPGDEFSTYETIKPFTEENGYYPAGSYLNGKVVESLGGGICQVSTTLYNAVLLSELDVTERNNHSMIVTYVEPSMDAAIAESSGKDFKFVNNYENPIYIEGTTAGKEITFTIYGVDTRDSGHKVQYISETLTTTQPGADEITASSAMAVGEISVQSAHIGYTAQLWRVITENGVEVSREVINKSTYKAAARSATVGVSSDNPTYVARMQAAIASGSIDTCKSEAAAIKAEEAAAAQQAADLEAYYNALAAQQAAAAAGQ
jgi:vancomycin resistance protein YoaR